MNKKAMVCAGVCTIKRPQMLEKCLRSLASQQHVGDFEFHILVVDNDATPSAAPVVEALSAVSPFPIHYFHEPRRGIPMARNRVLDEALALKAEWLAFFDDDQVVNPNCMERFLYVARRDKADAVAAGKIFVDPAPLPFWCVSNPDRKTIVSERGAASDGPLDSRKRKILATNGVLLSAKLFWDSGMALRFDERLALGGWEDGHFFEAAYRQGALLVNSCLPVVSEERHPSRFTFGRQMLASLSRGGAYVTRYRLENGYWRAAGRYSVASILRLGRGFGQLLVCPLFIPFAMPRFKFTALEGGRNLFTAMGMIGGLFSLQYEFYRQIDGC